MVMVINTVQYIDSAVSCAGADFIAMILAVTATWIPVPALMQCQ